MVRMVQDSDVVRIVIRKYTAMYHGVLYEFCCKTDVVQISSFVRLYPADPELTWPVVRMEFTLVHRHVYECTDVLFILPLHVGCTEPVGPLDLDVVVQSGKSALNSQMI